ncbi:hypothetical protein K402DRAFT_347841, partial [Aulographum hederae CBS 113979]
MVYFRHSPLPPSPPSIRLIHLSPGHSSSPLHATITHSSLASSDNTFEALSYCWGDPKRTRILYTPEGRIPLTRSLFNALRRLRSESDVRVLWADAACINQRENAEMSVQVGLMREIYRKAARVIAYLGEGRDDSHLALDLIGKLSTLSSGDAAWFALARFWSRPWFQRVWI